MNKERIESVATGWTKRLVEDVEILMEHIDDVDPEGNIISLQKGKGFLSDAFMNLADAYLFFSNYDEKGE